MERYLLFDSGCSLCTQLARDIEKESDGWLAAHSLGDPEMQKLLDEAKPDWQWEPTLVQIEHEEIQVFTGLLLRGWLLLKLGPKRAWHIAQIVSQQKISSKTNLERRKFLRQGSALLFALALWPRRGTAQAGELATANVANSVEVVSDDKTYWIQKALHSAELQIIAATNDFNFDPDEATVIQNTRPNGRQEVVVKFTAPNGDFVNYGELSSGYLRSRGGYYRKENETTYRLVALVINGESANLGEGQLTVMQDCSGGSGCEFEERSFCRPCGNYIRPTIEQCCVCPGGSILFCTTSWYGPCGSFC